MSSRPGSVVVLAGLLASLALVGRVPAEQAHALGRGAELHSSRLLDSRRPGPLRGTPLRHPTGLRLLVADVPPFVLDVDSGRIRTVQGIPTTRVQVLWVVGVGAKAAVVVAESGRARRLYAVRNSRARATYLGTGRNIWPSSDGRSVWVQGPSGRSGCMLRRVALDGRVLRRPRAFPCGDGSDSTGGSLGLVVNRTRIVDPLTGRVVFGSAAGIVAVVGDKAVLVMPTDRRLTLMDLTTRAESDLVWPDAFSDAPYGVADPQGRFTALGFGDPAYMTSGFQVLDVWAIDGTTGAAEELPSMPAFVSLKRTTMAWTGDGRLVLLAESDGRDMVAVWRPGQQRLEIKTIRLPDRSDSGSNSFAVLR